MAYQKEYLPFRKQIYSAILSVLAAVLLIPTVLEEPPPLVLEPMLFLNQDSIALPKSPEIETQRCTLDSEKGCQFFDIIVMAARRHKVQASLVMAIIQAESRYNPNAISPAGAQGLMQLMPRTAQAMGVTDSFDPEENVNGGIRYFKSMLKMFKGDLDLALAAYNAGIQNVLKHGGVPPFPETQNYISKVRSYHDRYKRMIHHSSVEKRV